MDINKMSLRQLRQVYLESIDSNPMKAFLVKKILEQRVNEQLMLRRQSLIKQQILMRQYQENMRKQMEYKNKKNTSDEDANEIESTDDIDNIVNNDDYNDSNDDGIDQKELVLDYMDKQNDQNNGEKGAKNKIMNDHMNKKMLERLNSDIGLRENMLYKRSSVEKPFGDTENSNHMKYNDIIKHKGQNNDFTLGLNS